MYTRVDVWRNFRYTGAPRVITPGVVRVATVRGVVQTWAIVRPGSSPAADGAPYYLGSDRPNVIIRSPSPTFAAPIPRIPMDPSNPQTWQRQYVFS